MSNEERDELSNKVAFLASVFHVMACAYDSNNGTPSPRTTAEALLSIAGQLEEIGKQIEKT